MAETKLSQNQDKIAYGVVGLLGLLVVLLPFLLGGTVGETRTKLEGEREKLEAKIAGEVFPPITEAKTRAAVAKQWATPAPSPSDPPWVTEIAPLVVKRYADIEKAPVAHEPPSLDAIECGRDAEKRAPYLVVRGAYGVLGEHGVRSGQELWRREGEGEFLKVADFPKEPVPGGQVEFRDYGVRAGEVYTYRLATLATLAAGAPGHVSDPAPKAESPELGPTEPVPYEFSLRPTLIPEEPGQSPRFFGSLVYWDYKEGKAVKAKQQEFKEKESFLDGRLEFFPVSAATQEVTVRNTETLAKEVVKQGAKHRPVDLWDALRPGAAAGAAADAEAAPEEGATPPRGRRARATAPEDEPPAEEAPRKAPKSPARARAEEEGSGEKPAGSGTEGTGTGTGTGRRPRF
jgi:hypothetical protein